MDLGLTGKRALVTGASEGLGRATVLLLAEEGCDVAFCARRAEPLEELADAQFVADVELKLFGYVRVARAALPHLEADGGGVVVNVAGNTGKYPYAVSMS